MRYLTFWCSAFCVAALGSLAIVIPTSSQAQTPKPGCGPVAYSNAEQKYVGVPCTAPAQKAEAGQPASCGQEAYSNAQQKYVGVPCTAPTQKAEAGKGSACGQEVYSNAQQKYVGVPCTQ